MTFRAQYHGECADCGGELKDTESYYNGYGEIQHVSCPKEPSRAEMCTSCFLIHAGDCP